jgi:hypothetical protein
MQSVAKSDNKPSLTEFQKNKGQWGTTTKQNTKKYLTRNEKKQKRKQRARKKQKKERNVKRVDKQ